MSSLRVLHVVAGLASRQGGVAEVVVQSSLALRGLGCANTIFATDLAEPASARRHSRVSYEDLPMDAGALDIHLFPVTSPKGFAYSPRLYDAVQREVCGYDLVHVHGVHLYPQLAGARAALGMGVPYVVSPHGALHPALRKRRRVHKAVNDAVWQRRLLNRAAGLVFTTEAEADLARDLGLRAWTYVVPHGINLHAFTRNWDAGRFRTRYLENFRGDFILSLGRIAHTKGNDLLIRAFARARRQFSPLRLVIAGPDDEGLTNQLAVLAKAEGVGHDVVFTGMLNRDDCRAALAAATALALPSRMESFGNVVLEAMASRLPVVISPEVNLAPDVEAAGAGVVCPRDPDLLARAIVEVLTDSRLVHRLIVRGERFARRFDWKRVAQVQVAMYHSALNRSESITRQRGLYQHE